MKDDRPRVGIVYTKPVPPGSTGGSVSMVIHQATRLLADEFAFTFVTARRGRDTADRIAGASYVSLGDRWDRHVARRWSDLSERLQGRGRHEIHRPSYYPFFARRAAEVLRDAGCTTVLVVQFPQWLPLLRRRLPHCRLLLWAHAVTFVEEKRSLAHQVGRADGVIGVSRFVVDRILERVPTLKGKGRVVYNGFDPNCFAPAESIPRSKRTLLFVGRIAPEKGVHVLAEAFRLLSRKYDDLELVLAGSVQNGHPNLMPGTDPAHLAEIRGLCDDYRSALVGCAGEAAARMRFAGSVSQNELANLYRRCSVYVQPTLCEEAFGMPLVEAMACGAPVVATRRGGMPEIVKPGETGLLTPSGDAGALAAEIDRLLADARLRRRLADRGREEVRKRFAWSRSAAALSETLRSAL